MFSSRSPQAFEPRPSRSALLIAAACACTFALAIPQRAAAQTGVSLGTAVTYWQVGQGETYLSWEQSAFLAEAPGDMNFGLVGKLSSGTGFWLRIQVSPNRAPRVDFQMENASDSSAAPNGACFNNLGARQCQLLLPADLVGKDVRFMVTKLSRTDPTDRWWTAWVKVDDHLHYIAQLKAPAQGGIAYIDNATNAWSAASGCTVYPRATTGFGGPTVSSTNIPPRKLPFRKGEVLGCVGPGAIAAPFYDGTVHVLGP